MGGQATFARRGVREDRGPARRDRRVGLLRDGGGGRRSRKRWHPGAGRVRVREEDDRRLEAPRSPRCCRPSCVPLQDLDLCQSSLVSAASSVAKYFLARVTRKRRTVAGESWVRSPNATVSQVTCCSRAATFRSISIIIIPPLLRKFQSGEGGRGGWAGEHTAGHLPVIRWTGGHLPGEAGDGGGAAAHPWRGRWPGPWGRRRGGGGRPGASGGARAGCGRGA